MTLILSVSIIPVMSDLMLDLHKTIYSELQSVVEMIDMVNMVCGCMFDNMKHFMNQR